MPSSSMSMHPAEISVKSLTGGLGSDYCIQLGEGSSLEVFLMAADAESLRDCLNELLPLDPPEAEDSAREVERHVCEAGTGADVSSWVDWFKTEYLLTAKATQLSADDPDVAARLGELHKALYSQMMVAVGEIGRICTGDPRDVPVAEAEDSAREVDGEARSELDAEIQKVANLVWPSFPSRGEKLVTSLRNCFTIFAEGRRDG